MDSNLAVRSAESGRLPAQLEPWWDHTLVGLWRKSSDTGLGLGVLGWGLSGTTASAWSSSSFPTSVRNPMDLALVMDRSFSATLALFPDHSVAGFFRLWEWAKLDGFSFLTGSLRSPEAKGGAGLNG